MTQIFISVIGGSNCSLNDEKLAEEVGQELAKRGVAVICGGLSGVMEAVCRGAASQGGLTIGILPGNDRRQANPSVKIPIVTGIGFARNAIVVQSAQAVIAIGGRYGTLSEIAYALQYGITVIGLDTWSFSRCEETDKSIIRANNPKEAVDKALEAAAKNLAISTQLVAEEKDGDCNRGHR